MNINNNEVEVVRDGKWFVYDEELYILLNTVEYMDCVEYEDGVKADAEGYYYTFNAYGGDIVAKEFRISCYNDVVVKEEVKEIDLNSLDWLRKLKSYLDIIEYRFRNNLYLPLDMIEENGTHDIAHAIGMDYFMEV